MKLGTLLSSLMPYSIALTIVWIAFTLIWFLLESLLDQADQLKCKAKRISFYEILQTLQVGCGTMKLISLNAISLHVHFYIYFQF